MKKRMLCLALALCVIFPAAVLPTSAGASTVYFSAVNDQLLKLSSSTMPAFVNGSMCVPYTMFSNNTLGVYFSYDRTEQKVSMLYGGKQIYFDMSTGEAFDADGLQYSATVAFYNSRIYVPVSFVCNFFGFTYSYITSEGVGAIIRIKDSSVMLSDSAFEAATRRMMTERLNKYLGDTETPASPSPSAPEPEQEPEQTYENTAVYLAFTGAEGADAVLDALEEHGMRASFFLTPDEISEDPDMVRRMVCQGHAVGFVLNGDGEKELAEASELLFETARRVSFLAVGESVPDSAAECVFDIDARAEDVTVTGLRRGLMAASGEISVIFDCAGAAETLPELLDYLSAGRYGGRALNELCGG